MININCIHRLLFFCPKLLIYFCLVIFILILWVSYAALVHSFNISRLMLCLEIAGISILVIMLAYMSNKYLSRMQYIVILGILAFCIRLIWITKIPTPVESDFLLMYNGALYAAKGDYVFAQQAYFTTWVYQLGFTMYESLIIKLFGEGTIALKILNIIYCTGLTVLNYLIASKVFNEWCGRIAGILYALNIPNILYGSVLTNQHLSVFLFYLTCYLVIVKFFTHNYSWIFVGIILTLGDIIRPLGYFFLMAIAIYILLKAFLEMEKTNRIKATSRLFGVVIVFYLFHSLLSYLFIAAGVTQYPLIDRDPLWKFVLGLNYETSGTYSQADENHVMSIKYINQRQHEEWNIIKERIDDKKKLLHLFYRKFSIMWGGVDASGEWSLSTLNKIKLERLLMKYERLIYMSAMIFGIIGLVSLISRKNDSFHYMLFLLIIIGYILIHFLIEIQTRYRYEITPCFTIIQSYGVFMTYKYLQKMRINNRD